MKEGIVICISLSDCIVFIFCSAEGETDVHTLELSEAA